MMKNQSKDPWGNGLEYQPGTPGALGDFTLCSNGPNGAQGDDEDIRFNRAEDE